VKTVRQICFSVLFVLGSNGIAQAHPIQGPGAVSCAKFAKMYQASPLLEETFYDWALGFMSAMNLAVQSNGGKLRELGNDLGEQKRSIRSYCAQNPLKDYLDAVMDHYGSLPFYHK
jgi:hypothetical protein